MTFLILTPGCPGVKKFLPITRAAGKHRYQSRRAVDDTRWILNADFQLRVMFVHPKGPADIKTKEAFSGAHFALFRVATVQFSYGLAVSDNFSRKRGCAASFTAVIAQGHGPKVRLVFLNNDSCGSASSFGSWKSGSEGFSCWLPSDSWAFQIIVQVAACHGELPASEFPRWSGRGAGSHCG